MFKGGVGGIGINIPELRKQDIAQFFAPKKLGLDCVIKSAGMESS